ncbi:hypothetical protein SAMN05216439_0068 [Methanobrevibacter gottschalkii]|uniref:Uncharacterized protein n=3 Tax=Methanobacteriaceae TaxID=2159 RepID=A0A3N5AYV7_9EURY|nr:hypothetical protein EDC42_1889 [Methanobrevibacter gottschalkii DSM 11977]SEL14333.1 hypothetical protein SAMN05216439_0068 [Methanobrevibacter gottschalkii]
MNKLKLSLVFFAVLLLTMSSVAATCNIIVITDPSGNDPNGAAAGSMSFADNMFQSTFLLSRSNHFAVLSGGTGSSDTRLDSIVDAVASLENNASAASAASLASQFKGARLVVGGPNIGAAVGGSFNAYVITVDDSSNDIKVTPYNSGVATLQPGQKGAIIHLRNTAGNPLYGTADSVRKETAMNIGKMIRDGYPATTILAEAMGEVAKDSGEKYGGGGVNLVSGISTSDMFTPKELNSTGYPMDEEYSKVCDSCGWAMGFPAAEAYEKCPVCGGDLRTVYAYQALGDALTVSSKAVSVSVYGSDRPGLAETTKEIVEASVSKYGYDASAISGSINRGINNGLLVGVDHVEPKDINVKQGSKAVGVYYKSLPSERSSPAWDLPIDGNILTILGSIQTAVGIILILLVLFRSRLLKSFQNR